MKKTDNKFKPMSQKDFYEIIKPCLDDDNTKPNWIDLSEDIDDFFDIYNATGMF